MLYEASGQSQVLKLIRVLLLALNKWELVGDPFGVDFPTNNIELKLPVQLNPMRLVIFSSTVSLYVFALLNPTISSALPF